MSYSLSSASPPMTSILLHIGYHKTGTTWLQKMLFKAPEQGFIAPWSHEMIVSDWVSPDSLSFSSVEILRRYQPELDNARAGGLVPVLSHERLSGYPSSGGYDSKLIADRLASAFSNANILIVIREQKSLIRSWYMQYVRDGGTLSVQRFLNPPQPHLARIPMFRFEFYEFDRLIAYYHHLFTPNNVLVLPFELLVKDPATFAGSIANHVETEPPNDLPREQKNIGRKLPWITIARLGNFLFSINQLNPGGCIHAPRLNRNVRLVGGLLDRLVPNQFHQCLDAKVRSIIHQSVGDRYRDSNRRAGALAEIDFGEFGYDC